jgi:hypothetical protein
MPMNAVAGWMYLALWLAYVVLLGLGGLSLLVNLLQIVFRVMRISIPSAFPDAGGKFDRELKWWMYKLPLGDWLVMCLLKQSLSDMVYGEILRRRFNKHQHEERLLELKRNPRKNREDGGESAVANADNPTNRDPKTTWIFLNNSEKPLHYVKSGLKWGK